MVVDCQSCHIETQIHYNKKKSEKKRKNNANKERKKINKKDTLIEVRTDIKCIYYIPSENN